MEKVIADSILNFKNSEAKVSAAERELYLAENPTQDVKFLMTIEALANQLSTKKEKVKQRLLDHEIIITDLISQLENEKQSIVLKILKLT